ADIAIHRAILSYAVWRVGIGNAIEAGHLHAAQEHFAAGSQVVLHRAGAHAAADHRPSHGVYAQLAGIAIVVNAVGPVGAEEISRSVGRIRAIHSVIVVRVEG